ncbi:hypothetical protein BDB01DRAFT_846963 [Pilobolus umbonatus]|nr:hypothetical protein BDB01DRAFT_846963 [Pilobolus umbonatus]
MSKQEIPPCQKFACAIQDCLQRNNYQEDKCRVYINKLSECCKDLKLKGGKSACCPK